MSITGNALPRWRGFNLLDFFWPDPSRRRDTTTRQDLAWMAGWGFDFVRLPMAYPAYLRFNSSKPITPEEVYQIDEQVVEQIDALVAMAHEHGLHVSLNLHRAPGYCINAGFIEPYNLWMDEAARDAFCHHWSFWAQRYRGMTSKQISFDLVNEPRMRLDMNDQHSPGSPVPGDVYREVAQAAVKAIRAHNPAHLVIADGNNVGNDVVPELIDLGIAQSCRGYVPGGISHYRAPWASRDPDNMSAPVWPGRMGKVHVGREMLEEHYRPWIELMRQGVGVHCGECGCWNRTPHHVSLAWFEDVLDILTNHGIGYALWNFRGAFGVLDSGRADVVYEPWHGHMLDRALLELLRRS